MQRSSPLQYVPSAHSVSVVHVADASDASGEASSPTPSCVIATSTTSTRGTSLDASIVFGGGEQANDANGTKRPTSRGMRMLGFLPDSASS
jgi:hypothetical protein